MRFLMIVKVKESRFYEMRYFEKETLDDVLKAIKEFPYNWELEKVYEVSGTINL